MHNNDWYKKGELPPVDTECEVLCEGLGFPEWERAKILFMGEFIVVYESESCKERSWTIEECKFRPIQSERDKLVNGIKGEVYIEAINGVDGISMRQSTGEDVAAAVVRHLYDANWRPVKQQSEDEFITGARKELTDHVSINQLVKLYRAGCRFIDAEDNQ